MRHDPPLPIDSVLPVLTRALATTNAAVLVAPPGAGKTTRVPLVLAREPWANRGKIVLLEPRRLAARAGTPLARETYAWSAPVQVLKMTRHFERVTGVTLGLPEPERA